MSVAVGRRGGPYLGILMSGLLGFLAAAPGELADFKQIVPASLAPGIPGLQVPDCFRLITCACLPDCKAGYPREKVHNSVL